MKIDRRVIKTQKAIIHALSELIEEKGFNNITIKDLTERADINRGTFYLHYDDKYDMLKKIEENIFSDFSEIFKRHLDNGDMRKLFLNEPNPIVMDILRYVEENNKLFKAIIGPKGDPKFSSNLKAFLGNMLRSEEAFDTFEFEDLPVDYVIAYFAAADLGVIQFWLENDMDQSMESIAMLLTKMLSYGMVSLNRNRRGKKN